MNRTLTLFLERITETDDFMFQDILMIFLKTMPRL